MVCCRCSSSNYEADCEAQVPRQDVARITPQDAMQCVLVSAQNLPRLSLVEELEAKKFLPAKSACHLFA